MVEPQTGFALFNAIASAGKTIYEIAQGASKLEEKQRLLEVYDTLMNLKRDAADLEDQNRELRENLRFKSDDFEFKNPFWYEKTHPDRPLCAKCFAQKTIAPMGEQRSPPGELIHRSCLVCNNFVKLGEGARNYRNFDPDPSPWS